MTTYDVIWADDENATDCVRIQAVSAEDARQKIERRRDCAEVLLVDEVFEDELP